MAAWLAGAKDFDWRDWLSVVGLLAVIAVMGWILFDVWVAALNPHAVGCHNAPYKVVRYPQLVGIGLCLAGLVLGRISARPVTHARSELKRKLVPGDERHKHVQFALYTQLGMTGALLFITFLVTFESLTLWRGVWPITYYMRCAAEAATWQTYVAAVAFSALVGRWLWLPRTPT